MAEQEQTTTVEMSLEMFSDALGRASDDLRAVQVSLDQARTDLASRNTSVSRQVIKDADRAMTHLKTDRRVAARRAERSGGPGLTHPCAGPPPARYFGLGSICSSSLTPPSEAITPPAS